MSRKKQSAIIISVSSDIGTAMARGWMKKGWKVCGTYRTQSKAVEELSEIGVGLIHCDILDKRSVQKACSQLRNLCPKWDNLILAPGTQDPVGSFMNCNFDDWADSIQVNFTNQLRIVQELMPARNTDNVLGPCVLFFAGGGTNDATVNYSAYTISKIGLIKMCELLDAEIPDVRFAILGPGWVKTKIHRATLKAAERAGDNYEKTKYKLNSDELTPMEAALDCCDWLISSPRNIISGRNFSVVYDMWGTKELSEKLVRDFDMYKLRRHGNELLKKGKNMFKSEILENLIYALPEVKNLHSPETKLHALLKQVARKEVENLFSEEERNVGFEPFGTLKFPYHSMGAVDSLNLFDLDELIIFSFYWINRKSYKNVLDLGACIGLHSIILDKCGYNVRSYEPDPLHFDLLKKNLDFNNCSNVEAINAAISYKDGEMEFIRVLGNTTGSHLAGSKPDAYGKLEKFPVKVESIGPMLKWADLVKMDIEGHEKEIFINTPIELWRSVDVLLEVQNENNAEFIFDYFKSSGLKLFSEKCNWLEVTKFLDMPTSYREGTLFITPKSEMPWS